MLAKQFNGEIISADSRQIYRGLDIGTGKEGESCGGGRKSAVSSQQSAVFQQTANSKLQALRSCLRCIDGVPQWMIDIVAPEERFTLFDYLDLARLAIEDIFSRGKVPIIVGGTGLYVQALTEGFKLERSAASSQQSAVVNLQSANRKPQTLTRERLNNLTTEELNDILSELDPESHSTIDQKNPRRLIRAIEKAQSGEKTTKIKPDFEVLQIGLDLPREELHQRIDRRVDERFEQGMLDEVIGLIKSDVSPEWLQSLGLEYREITSYLLAVSGGQLAEQPQTANRKPHTEFELMKQQLKFAIHQFARRQLTWFRRFPEIKWLNNDSDIRIAVSKFINK